MAMAVWPEPKEPTGHNSRDKLDRQVHYESPLCLHLFQSQDILASVTVHEALYSSILGSDLIAQRGERRAASDPAPSAGSVLANHSRARPLLPVSLQP